MKKIVLLIAAMGLFVMAKAQQYARGGFSIGPEINFPSQSVYNIGYGASAKLVFPVAGKVGLSLSGGYTKLHYKGTIISTFGDQKPSEFIPLKAGLVYDAGMGLYLNGELGAALESSTNINGSKRSPFAYAIGPGFLIAIKEKQAVDIGVRYEQWSQQVLKQVAIRVAYRFGW